MGAEIRRRKLFDRQSGKHWETRCEGATLTIRSGMPGKEKEAAKVLGNAAEARAKAEKEEWARLKKGWLAIDPEARPGMPNMHCFVGGAYTGAMAIAAIDGAIVCNRSGRDGAEQLLCVSGEGDVAEVASLPDERLVWKLVDMPERSRTLLLADHQVMAWDRGGNLEALTVDNRSPASFLSVAGTRAAWFAEPEIVVRDLAAGRDVFHIRAEPQLYGGHSPQMEGALSPDGAWLAWSAQAGEIRIVELATGAERAPLVGDFAMVGGLWFLDGGASLLVKEDYGNWRLLCFDLASGGARPDWPKFGNIGDASIALDAAGRRLAVADRRRIAIHDLMTMKPLLNFSADHVVKRAAIAWAGEDRLGVRTDYGCVSLYAIA